MVRSSFMARRFAVLALILALFSSIVRGAPIAAQEGKPALDLPAIVFTAADLEDAGFEDYVVYGAGPFDLASDAQYISESQQLDYDEVEQTFTEAGHQGSYYMLYKLPADPGDPAGTPMRELQTTVYLFADADGAAAAYEVIADESQTNSGADLDNVGLNLGDESEMTTLMINADANYGLPNTQIELEILFDRMVVEISTYNYDPETVGMPIFEVDEMETLEALGERLLERAQAVLDGDSPNLAPALISIEGAIPDSDYVLYQLIDGEGIRSLYETRDDFESTTEARVERGTVNILHQEQALTEGDAAASGVRFYNNILTYERQRDAMSYMDGLVDRFSESERYTNAEGEEIPDLGDQAIAVTLEFERANGDPAALTELFVRVGEVVVGLWIDQPEATADEAYSADGLIALAEAQIECLDAGVCPDPVAMPDELAEIVGAPDGGSDEESASDDAEATGDDEDTADAGGDRETEEREAADEGEAYESPRYGYTLTYDPEVWEVSAEDDDPDDDYDRVTLQTDEGFVGIIGDPDYRASQLDDCVADYQAGFEQGDGVDNVRAMRGESGEDEDRAWAAFTYDLIGDDDEEPLEAARYIECRTYDDVTIVILQTSLEADYDDLSAAREVLLEGLE